MSAAVVLAKPFLDSLGGLTVSEKGQAFEFVKEFQGNPANPGIRLERVQGCRSPDVWSGRVSRDLRAILHKDGDTWVLLRVGHHDTAYEWAERRDIGRHSATGALQVIELAETTHEVAHPRPTHSGAPPLLGGHPDGYLLSLGVPASWLPALRVIETEDQLLEVCAKLPEDVAEHLLTIAEGGIATPPIPVSRDAPVTSAPDTQRGFFVINDTADLEAAFRAPMARWVTFLHPEQRSLVEQEFGGPAKVSGSAGTGKTVVAMHRARHLARCGERVLLTSYVKSLCGNIERNLQLLCSGPETNAITVSTVHKQALDIVKQSCPEIRPATDADVRDALKRQRPETATDQEWGFVQSEWKHVVRAQGIESWDEYRGAVRSGRGRGLSVRERKRLWQVFEGVLGDLRSRDLLDWAGISRRATELLAAGEIASPYTAVVVDEVQDLGPSEIRFLVTLCGKVPGNLMVCGDTGQRIYSGGFSLGALGVNVRGRSRTLRLNYRTSEQIRRQADRLLDPTTDDMDGGTEGRGGTRSLFGGPEPRLIRGDNRVEEADLAVKTVQGWLKSGYPEETIGVFARTRRRIGEIAKALGQADITFHRISDDHETGSGGVQLSTMHGAKGLEFRAVLVVGVSAAEMPNRAALNEAADPADREAVTSQECRLLYVSMTRAREELTVTWSGRPSQLIARLTDKTGDSGGV